MVLHADRAQRVFLRGGASPKQVLGVDGLKDGKRHFAAALRRVDAAAREPVERAYLHDKRHTVPVSGHQIPASGRAVADKERIAPVPAAGEQKAAELLCVRVHCLTSNLIGSTQSVFAQDFFELFVNKKETESRIIDFPFVCFFEKFCKIVLQNLSLFVL